MSRYNDEIDRPAKSYKQERPDADPELIEALLRTVLSGRAVPLTDAELGLGGCGGARGPAQGHLYGMGYNTHQKAVSQGLYAVWAERGKLVCARCAHEEDMVARIDKGLKRLRTRDDCPTKCGGRMALPKKEESA